MLHLFLILIIRNTELSLVMHLCISDVLWKSAMLSPMYYWGLFSLNSGPCHHCLAYVRGTDSTKMSLVILAFKSTDLKSAKKYRHINAHGWPADGGYLIIFLVWPYCTGLFWEVTALTKALSLGIIRQALECCGAQTTLGALLIVLAHFKETLQLKVALCKQCCEKLNTSSKESGEGGRLHWTESSMWSFVVR